MISSSRFPALVFVSLFAGISFLLASLIIDRGSYALRLSSLEKEARALSAAHSSDELALANTNSSKERELSKERFEAFAQRVDLAGARTWSPSAVLLFAIGLVFFLFSMYQIFRYSSLVRKDAARMRAIVDGEALVEFEAGDCRLEAFREVELKLRQRLRWFEDWFEKLNNERTEALTALEREKNALLERLSRKAQTAQQAENRSDQRGDFLAVMSHEIRTPMNGVLAIADDLLSYDLDREIKDRVEMIKLSGESLVRILDDVLDFSKIEAGKLDVKLESFDLVFACSATYALFKSRADEKELNYRLDISEDTPRHILGDSVRLRQVIANLLSNALKFTEEGKVVLSVGRETREKEGIFISVSDTGMGIDADRFHKLFESFAQAESGLEEKGTGLGLAISKRLAALMDGDLSYAASFPKGSVFKLWIPYFKGSPVDEVQAWPNSDLGSVSAKILIVEDNRINQHVIESLLERASHTVHIAANGLEALEKVETDTYDIIFMDCLMPKLDGYEAARRIRALPPENGNRETPIIALTANAFAQDRELCFESGMDDFLAKPVKKDTLLGVVNRYCQPPDA
ncbi:response regulator receiver domain protein [Verrucomicrobiia bacterium DG1235]|nr:response regulator receiver domain protein [Verrucomicrobiae bacterium DG1235]